MCVWARATLGRGGGAGGRCRSAAETASAVPEPRPAPRLPSITAAAPPAAAIARNVRTDAHSQADAAALAEDLNSYTGGRRCGGGRGGEGPGSFLAIRVNGVMMITSLTRSHESESQPAWSLSPSLTEAHWQPDS